MRELLHHPALADVPFIIETPGRQSAHARHIATLKALRDDGPAVVSALARLPRATSAGRRPAAPAAAPGTAAVPDSETVAVT